MRTLTIVYFMLACTMASYAQTTATYDNVRARQQLTLNGHTLTSVLQTIDSLSTHAQGVTAKAVYDYIATKYSTVSAGTGIDVVKAGTNYTISLDTLKRLHFRTDSTYTGGVGTMRWNTTDGTLDLGLKGGNVTLQLGQESVQLVKHADNTGLTNGKVVYIVGSDGDNKTVRYAQANAEATSANTFGLITETVTGGAKAFCTTFGMVHNLNTSNLTEGGMVWLSKDTAGAMTAVRPTAPNHGVEIGFCVRKHTSTGIVFVTVQNGYELRELHDVYAPSPTNNQGLLWKSANSRWEAATIDTSLTNEGKMRGSRPSSNAYYDINTSTVGSNPITLYRGTGIGFDGTSGSPEGGSLTISNTGDLDTSNEGVIGVSAGTSTSSVITSNTSTANGVTINAGTGISLTESTSSNGGSITVSNSDPDQSVTNEGRLSVEVNPGADAFINSNTSGQNSIGLVGTNNTTIVATASSNGGQIVFDSKATIDTFSVSGSTLSLSLKNDGQAAKTVTLPSGGSLSGVTGYVSQFNSSTTIDTTGLFWGNGSRLGIGTTTPSARVDIVGESTTSATNAIEVNNSSRELLKVANNGAITIGKNDITTTQNTASIAASGSDANIGIAIVPKGTGAITAQIPDGALSGGIARGDNAVDFQMLRGSTSQVAKGAYSVIIGGAVNVSNGKYAISGGYRAASQGNSSIALGGWETGVTHSAGGNYSYVIGGYDNSASAEGSGILGGRSSTASGNYSTILGGQSNVVSAANAIVIGGQYSNANLQYQRATANSRFGASGNPGDIQTSDIRLARSITGTAASELTIDGTSPVSATRAILNLPTGATNGRLWNAKIQLSAICQTAGGSVTVGESFIGTYNVGIKRIGANTSLVGTVQNMITAQSDTNMSSSVVTITADDTNESLKIEFTPPTGANASTVIRVVATVYLTEVGY